MTFSDPVGGDETGEHHWIVEGGVLVAWPAGVPVRSDLHLSQPERATISMLLRTGVPEEAEEAARATTFVTPDGHVPVPPVDEVLSDWGSVIPVGPDGGDIVVLQILTHTPFGALRTWFIVDRGPVKASGLGPPPREPDIVVQRPMDLALEERAGSIDVLSSLERGGVHGDTGKLMMFLGGFDSPECQAARRTLATPRDHLWGRLAAILGSPGWSDLANRWLAGRQRSGDT